MRKYLIYTIFLFFFYSCISSDSQPSYLIGVSQCSDDLWRRTMNNEIMLEASIYKNIEVNIKTVKDDTNQQINDIEELIAQGVNLLVVSPNESKALTPIIQKAYRKGIPVILVDRKIDTDDYTTYIGADNYQIGKEAGTYIAGVLNGKGNVVEMRGWEGSTSDVERHQGFVDVISKYPAIKIIAESRGNFLPDESEKQMAKIIREHSQIDLVFALNDPMASGVYNALSKYSGQMPFIIGIDALPGEGGGIESIENGRQNASFIYPTGGDKVVDMAVKILSGEKVNRENILFTTVVDKRNVRVLQLQTELLKEHQVKLKKVNDMLNKSLAKYTSQQILFYVTIIALVLMSVVLLLAMLAYRAKTKANKLLKEQKDQLISLSEQLEEATNAKLVFFTNISHEFRTPLTLILGPVETLMASEQLTSEQRTLLDLVKRNSNSLLNLVSQIIEFRTYENGKMDVHFVEDDFKSFVKYLSIPFFDYAKRKNLDFVVKCDLDVLSFPFDKEKIERIYFNLLSNAFKYSERGGVVEVLIDKEIDKEQNGGYAKLVVRNDSKVIPKDKIDNIFNRFYKVNPTDAGTGIGLSLVSALVEIHNGRIHVESSKELGTSFTVLLPLIQSDNEIKEEYLYEENYILSQLQSSLQDGNEDTFDISIKDKEVPIVLIIEDNADMRHFMRMILESEFNVIEARDGKSGIEKAMKFVPDIIISDVMMPEKDGFEVCKTIKETITTSHIPVIILTACSLDEQKAIGFESGADAYIAKPFNADILKIRIRKLIESRRRLVEAFGHNIVSDELKVSQGEQEQLFIDQFRVYIEENISNPELNVEDIAANLGLSKSQLYRKVKSLTSYSPNELTRIIRLQYGKQLLIHREVNISEIAYKSGFSSLSYFSKCFKEQYKESPTEYLESLVKD